ncbi:MAG: hypothetical protein VB082_10005 [Christensenella sp.]|nr:hypothetical protein [Christensenella sp.]
MKKIICIVAVIVLLCVPVAAFAAVYQDPAADFTVEIPEKENVYYYTASETNMTDDLLKAIQSKMEGLCFMVTAYGTDQSLSYSLDMKKSPVSPGAALPVTTQVAAASPATAASPAASAAPSASATVGVADLSSFSEEQMTQLVENEKAGYGADYAFDPYSVGSINGKTALVLTGHQAQDNGYTTKIYMLAQNDELFVITALYKNDAANTYLNEVTGVLHSLQFSTGNPAAEFVTPTPEPTASIAPEATPATSGIGATISGFFHKIGVKIQNSYQNDPNFVYYAAGCITIIAGIIIAVVLISSRHKHKDEEETDEPPQPDSPAPEGGDSPQPDSPMAQYQEDISRYTQQPKGYDMSDISRYTQQPVGLREPGNSKQAYSPEDISRYTQNPQGYDAADISRYVHTPSENSETLPEDITSSPQEKKPSSTPKVGSRMDRYKKKK